MKTSDRFLPSRPPAARDEAIHDEQEAEVILALDGGVRQPGMDPVLLAVLANRFEAIVREMTNTLQRAAYSPLLSLGRDFSCSIVTAENELLACAEGLPVHIFGSHLMAEAMTKLHPDLAEGDAFLHNDPYLGGSHPADHTILVPIFIGGVHTFTAVVKGHMADIGNALASTYVPGAKDVYEEGGQLFPCVHVERGFQHVEDIIRMCRARIRAPEHWYGDFLAMLAAARIGERRVIEVTDKYGLPTIRSFVREWLDYSERRMVDGIRKLPTGDLRGSGRHDPFPGLPDGIPLNIVIRIDSARAMVEIDLRDNIDCVDAGLNESVAVAISSVMQGVLSVLDPDIPHNAGSFRRIAIQLRENCVVGIPEFPHSCSLATSNPAFRLVNLTHSTFADIGEGWGLAEGGVAHNIGFAVISGSDPRFGGAPFVNQILLGSSGGPGTPVCDGWVMYFVPVVSGLMYRDSVEIDEQRFPILIRELKLAQDSGGAGRFRGAPATLVEYGPRFGPISVTYPSDGFETAPRGVRGGHAGSLAAAWKIDASGRRHRLPNVFVGIVEPGEWVTGVDSGGGGYGDPLERDPEAVARDVAEGWVSPREARTTYGVVLMRRAPRSNVRRVDFEATAERRALIRTERSGRGTSRERAG